MTLKNIDTNNALITIRNNQTYDGKSECLEITTEGRFTLKNGTYFLLYREYTEMGESSVVLRAFDDSVSMRRKGVSNARMDYKKGLHQEVLYNVPYGDLIIDLETESVEIDLNERNGGTIKITYSLGINGELYYNDMEIGITMNCKSPTGGKGDLK